MQEVQNIINVKLLLSIISFLLLSNIALIGWMAKKYIKRVDSDHERINALYSEHMIFHKKNTGLNGK